MLFARIRPIFLSLLMFLPIIASGLLVVLAEHNKAKHLRMLVLSTNLSTFFAMVFVCWIATLVYVLAPSFRSKFFAFAGLTIGVLFRLFEDSITLDVLNVTGQIPILSFVSLDSPIFVMHVLVSLFMISLLVFLARWLIRKEKSLGFEEESKIKTILWFIIFPVGIWFIQPRMRKILDEEKPVIE